MPQIHQSDQFPLLSPYFDQKKRGILLGILSKEKVISELSDIERVNRQKIDDFITKVLRKMTLDDLLPLVGNIKEFVVINLFCC